VLSPLMRIVPVQDALPPLDGMGALIVTSAHAVAALARAPGGCALTCYCVGAATAGAARAAGLKAIEAGGTAEALIRRVIADHPPAPLLYARGEHVARDLAKTLCEAGLETHQAVVYRQLADPLSDAARDLLAGPNPVIVPLFSAHSARLLLDAAPPRAPLAIAAISENVARAVSHAAQVRVAATPDAEAMIDCTEALVSHLNRVESGRTAQ